MRKLLFGPRGFPAPVLGVILVALAGCPGARAPEGAAPSQIMEDFTLTQTSRGQTRWNLRAAQARIGEAEGDVALSSLELRMPQEGGHAPRRGRAETATRIGSHQGIFNQKTQDIFLSGNVVVTGPCSDPSCPAGSSTTLRTDALQYRNATQRFETDRAVLIERPGSRMRGKGLIADRDLSEIRVLSQEASFQ